MNAIQKFRSFAIVLGLTAILTFGSAALSHTVPQGGSSPLPELQYSVSGCEEGIGEKATPPLTKGSYPAKKISVAAEGNRLKFTHALSYVCCAELHLERRLEARAIAITEINEGDYCRCMCDYSIEATLGPLAPGTYDFKVLGVGYRPPSGTDEIIPQLLFQTQLEIGEL